MSTIAAPTVDGVEVIVPEPGRTRFAPADRLRLAVGLGLVLAGIAVAAVARSTVEGLEEDLVDALDRLPDGFESTVLGIAQVATSLIPLIAFVVLLARRRWRVALLLLVTSIVANLAMIGIDVLIVDRDLQDVLDRLGADDSVGDAGYPSSHVLAVTTAQVTVAAAFLSRRWKRALWWGVGLLALLRLVAVAYPAFDIVLALGVGVSIGSLVLLVFGSPSNEPGPEELVDGLRDAGVEPRRIVRVDPMGSALRYRATATDGSEHLLALRTPDERQADLLTRTYRNLRYQSSEVGQGFPTVKQRVEHEALVLTLAERAGVAVPHVDRVGTTERGSAFLVVDDPGDRSAVAEDLTRPDLLRALWRQVGRLHDAGVAHRRLALEAIGVDDEGRPVLDGFDDALVAPDRRERSRDVAQLLTETALVLGACPAVEAAVEGLGPDRVADAQRMLQPLALPSGARARAKEERGLLDELRAQVREQTGAEDVRPADLERIRPRTAVVVVASALAFYTLLPQLGNLSDTVDAFGDAHFGWIAGALLLSALSYVFAAVSFAGAVADPVPFAPNLRAQVAASFAGLVGPAGAGGFAVSARFLQRAGVGGPEAAASVGVNAIGGFAAHLVLLVVFVVWSGQNELEGFSLPDSTTVLLLLAIVLALLGVLLAIAPVRRRVLRPALDGIRTGLGQIGAVFRRPERVLALFGGSAGISLAYVAAMACCVEAFGGGLDFVQIGAAYLAAMAVATLAPTPGGLGAVESALIAALTGFGLADGVAVSSVLTFRLATFWLPILPGWLTLGWMQRNEEV